MRVFCTTCGAEVADGTRFCPYCGAKVVERPGTLPGALGLSGVSAPSDSQAAAAPLPPEPQPPAVPKPCHRGRIVLVAIALIAFAIGAITASTYYLGLWGRAADAAKQTAARVAPFGSKDPSSISAVTRIVPSASENKPLEHYFVRILEATDAQGKAISVFDYPRLEVTGAHGFCMADFAGNLPLGTYLLASTDDGGTERALPPVTLQAPSGGSGAAGGSYDGSPSVSGSTSAGTDGAGTSAGGSSTPSTPSDGASADAGATTDEPLVIVPSTDKDAQDAAKKKGRYAAFLKVIEDLQKQYGEGKLNAGVSPFSDDGSWISGLADAQPIDFGDGSERLLVTYLQDTSVSAFPEDPSVYHFSIYRYDEASDSAKQEAEGACGHDHVGQATYGLTVGSDGRRLFVADAEWESEKTISLYGLNGDGAVQLVKTIYGSYRADGGPSAVFSYRVNGKDVDEATWNAEVDQVYGASFAAYSLSGGESVGAAITGKVPGEYPGAPGSVQYGIKTGLANVADLTAKLGIVAGTAKDIPTKQIDAKRDPTDAADDAEKKPAADEPPAATGDVDYFYSSKAGRQRS